MWLRKVAEFYSRLYGAGGQVCCKLFCAKRESDWLICQWLLRDRIGL